MNPEINQIANIKIKPLRYTLMELREINFLKRKGRPIPPKLLNKPFEDFDVGNELKSKKANISKTNIEEIKENNNESSDLSNTIKQKENTENEIDEKKNNDSKNKSKESSLNENGGFKLQLFNADNSDDNKSSESENEE